MTQKKLVKEMMSLGISRNAARRVVSKAREWGISNVSAWWLVCIGVLQQLMHDLGLAADEQVGDTGWRCE